MRWIDVALLRFRQGLRHPTVRGQRLAVECLEDRIAPAYADFRSVIGLNQVQTQYPYNGAGYSVAVLDTGIDYNDTALGGGFGPGHRVIAGYNFVANNSNPMDDNGHGTLIAGIIGSSDPSAPGIAPDVNFIDLKVLDANNSGNWSSIDQGLQWVVSHKAQYNIVAVNLSLGSGNYSTDTFSLLANDLANLKGLGVFTAVASGNGYNANSVPGLSYPAINPNVVSVGATWAGSDGAMTWSSGAIDYSSTVDQIVSSTQRSSALSLLAPGAWITSTGLNNTSLTLGGTSMATAVVSGSAALLHQAYDLTGQGALASEDNILHLMQSTGVAIKDTNNGVDNVQHTGLTFKRLNLKAAMDELVHLNSPPVLSAIPNQTMSHSLHQLTVSLAATDADNDPITFSAKVLPGNGQTPAVTVVIKGNQLTISPVLSVVGSFIIQVNASDGKSSVSGTFTVTLTNAAPTLNVIGPQTMVNGQTILAVPLSASDADHDPLKFQAVAQTPDPAVYQLKQQFGFQQYNGSYYTNLWGYQEKWLVGNNNSWFMLLPDGKLYRWALSITRTMQPANLIVTLDPKVYTEPRLLWNANPPITPALTFAFQGSQLTIQRPAGLTGVFFVDVTVNDGFTTTKRTLQITLN